MIVDHVEADGVDKSQRVGTAEVVQCPRHPGAQRPQVLHPTPELGVEPPLVGQAGELVGGEPGFDLLLVLDLLVVGQAELEQGLADLDEIEVAPASVVSATSAGVDPAVLVREVAAGTDSRRRTTSRASTAFQPSVSCGCFAANARGVNKATLMPPATLIISLNPCPESSCAAIRLRPPDAQ